MTASATRQTLALPISGMDCGECARHVEHAIAGLPGVDEVHVLLSTERATVTFDPQQTSLDQIKRAVDAAGYSVRASAATETAPRRDWGRMVGWGALGLVGTVVAVAVAGETLGIFDRVVDSIPWWLMAAAVLIAGWPIFRNVAQAAFHRQITSHTLMTIGVAAAALGGYWTTALLVVFFMRFGEMVEAMTTARSRQAIQSLMALQPVTARVRRDGGEVDIPVETIAVGDVVVVRPGERIPVDGEVVAGAAPVNQAAITGESAPLDKEPGDAVFAATVAEAGYLEVRATGVGQDTAFGHILRLVEEAETHKAPVQRFADRFAGYYTPFILIMAALAWAVTGETLNAVAVLVVSCACAITLATPVVVLASVGAAARQGLLIKGGLALEQLARVDTLVMDKTGTLTFGVPTVTDVVALDGIADADLLRAVAAVEARSEHPLARAITRAARDGAPLAAPQSFTPLPGRGLVARLDDHDWAVGNRRLLTEQAAPLAAGQEALAASLEAAGKTVFFAARDQRVVGLVALADTVRPEIRAALDELRGLGVQRFLLLTGDAERVAAALAHELGVEYRAQLLPQQKIRAVGELQAAGARVLMVGDGINDAPALKQADVGIALGGIGTDVAVEAADVILMRDDWRMVPEAIRLGRRATGTIRQNLLFTAVYNTLGISLAFLGILPPALAAAFQSVPDVAIMLNSARLGRWRAGANH